MGASLAVLREYFLRKKKKIETTHKDLCINCLFFKRDTASWGYCKYNAPIVVYRNERLHPSTETKWPSVDINEWCGQHAPKTFNG